MSEMKYTAEQVEEKIRAIFAKAVSMMGTEGGEGEAQLALQKAQELAVKYQVDLEKMRQSDKAAGRKVSMPVERTLHLSGGPYLRHRAALASNIFGAMDLPHRIAINGSFVRPTGFPEDIDMAWQIFQIVEPQMLAMADRRVRNGAHKDLLDYSTGSMHMDARTYKANFFEGFRSEIASRIMHTRSDAGDRIVLAEGIEGPKGEVQGRVTGELVLASRTQEVQRVYNEKYPEITVNPETGRKVKQRPWRSPSAVRSSLSAEADGRDDGRRARLQGNELASRKAIR